MVWDNSLKEFPLQLRAFDLQVFRQVRQDCAESTNAQAIVVGHGYMVRVSANVGQQANMAADLPSSFIAIIGGASE